MIDVVLLDHLRQSADVSYERYTAPFGDIYILGNDISLKALIFRKSYPGKKSISTIFARGASDSIAKAIHILDYYFNTFRSHRKGEAVKSTKQAITKNSSLNVTIYYITLQLDLSYFTSNEIAVYQELMKIPAGAAISYGALAHCSGIPRGARFVGNTMAKNRFPIIIPCHRVIKSDGSMGNYSGGVDIKKHLLAIEQI